MDFNKSLKKAQGNPNLSPAKEKRAHSPYTGSDDEGPATPKRIKVLQVSKQSPIQRSPADSVTSPTSCEKRTDESSESPSTPGNRRRRRRISGSAAYRNLETILQTNFKMLKERMESTELAERLHAKGIIDDKAVENIQCGCNRRNRNDILIKALCKPGIRENVDVDTFLSALNESGQSTIVKELVNRPGTSKSLMTTCWSDITANERRDLLSFASQREDLLLEEVDPWIFIDEIVTSGGITIKDHEDMSTFRKRRQRIQFLLEKIRSANPSTAIRIIKPMADGYKDIYEAFKADKKGSSSQQEQTVEKHEVLVAVGSSIQMKLQIMPVTTSSVEDKNAHDDPATVLRKKKQQIEEIEKRIVSSVNKYPERLKQLYEECIAELKEAKISCIKIYMKALSKGSLDKLVAYSRSDAAKRLFLSLIDDDTKAKLVDRKAKVVIEIYRGSEPSAEQVPPIIDCMCSLGKESVTRKFTPLMKGMRGSRKIINRFLESLLKDDVVRTLLKKILNVKQVEERNNQLLTLLLEIDVPKVFFCILEEEIITHGGEAVIRDVIEDNFAQGMKENSKGLTKRDIDNNKALLREELEARWFIHRLEKKKDRRTDALVDSILKSGSREERVDSFLEYLLKERDLTWFSEELEYKNKHLLSTLLHSKMSGKDCKFANLDVSRIEKATRFYIDDIIEEVDPLILSERLKEKAKQEIYFSELNAVQERKERATKFCLALLGASQRTFCETLDAMVTCGYKNIVDDITTLAKEGPLNSRYKCAKLQHLLDCCNESSVFKQEFILEENNASDLSPSPTSAQEIVEVSIDVAEPDCDDSDDDCTIVKAETSQLSTVEDENQGCIEIFDNSPVPRKLSRRSRVQSLKGGSESGIFSGSGAFTEDINTDEDSDIEERSSRVDRRRRTKEWIESHSESVSFGITTQSVSVAIAPLEEGRTNLQDVKGLLKHKEAHDFIAPLEKIRGRIHQPVKTDFST